MQFKYILIFIICTSCALNQNKIKNTYSSQGFAYVYNEEDKLKKLLKIKLNNQEKAIAHNKLRVGTLVNIYNPDNKKNITLKVSKKVDYPNFYTILITEEVAKILELNRQIPFVQIEEISKKKSFVAKKADMFNEEKKVENNAPIQRVQIKDLSVKINKKSKIVKNFSIIIGEFYSLNSATNLKKKITNESIILDNKKIRINFKNKNNFELFSGPYSSINLLKNDYIELKKFGFEELDIKINE
jgi:rare lipoprotein A (peptidoglycan hydrolase)|tara:strand:- start:13 stop:741 length:729 start_codon:yes stop_codon:yes gene_type:complete